MEACGGRWVSQLDNGTISWVCMASTVPKVRTFGCQSNKMWHVRILPIYANTSVTFIYLVVGWAGRLNFGTPGARTLSYFEVLGTFQDILGYFWHLVAFWGVWEFLGIHHFMISYAKGSLNQDWYWGGYSPLQSYIFLTKYINLQ